MAAEHEDQVTSALAAQGRMRASDADRDRVVDVLQAAFAQGRLTADELAAHLGRALRSRTWAELAAVTAGLSASRSPAPGRVRGPVSPKKVAVRAAWVIIPPGVIAAFLTYYGGFIVIFVLALMMFILTAAPPGAGARRRRRH